MFSYYLFASFWMSAVIPRVRWMAELNSQLLYFLSIWTSGNLGGTFPIFPLSFPFVKDFLYLRNTTHIFRATVLCTWCVRARDVCAWVHVCIWGVCNCVPVCTCVCLCVCVWYVSVCVHGVCVCTHGGQQESLSNSPELPEPQDLGTDSIGR